MTQWKRICLPILGHQFNPWLRKTPLEKEMATHSSILACDIPWTEEPGRLQSMDSHTEHTETVYSWGQRDFNAKLTSNF